jgi:branched-chain amino acid transport system ATP-binding protein
MERHTAAAGGNGQAPLLSVNNIEVIYNHVILVLKGVSLEVPEGGVIALLGANGAGKTTTLKAISNLLRAERGEVTKGSIELEGEKIQELTPNDLVKKGVIQVMEGRHCFEHLTVEENLLTGAYTRRDGNAEIRKDLEKVYGYFPRLKERRRSSSRSSSSSTKRRGCPSCWPNRTPTWPSSTPPTAISWKTAGSCWTAMPRGCAKTRT